MIDDKIIDDKIIDLVRDTGFVEYWLGDNSGRWYQLDFEFGGGKFEFVVDIDQNQWWLSLGGNCSEEISKGDLNYEDFVKILTKWEVI